MNSDKKNIIYTAKDIEAYFSGKLSPVQMHTMEKAALDDPFLAEAMEGYEGMKAIQWSRQLAALHQQFEEMGSPAKVIPMNRSTTRWWKTAAAVLVIGSGAAVTWWFTKEKAVNPAPDHNQIAQTISPKKDTGTPITSTTATITTTTVSPAEVQVKTIKPQDQKLKTETAEITPSNNVEGRLAKPVKVSDSNSVAYKQPVKPQLLEERVKQLSDDQLKSESFFSNEDKGRNKASAITANVIPPVNSAAISRETNETKNTEPAVSLTEDSKKKAVQNQKPSGRGTPVTRNFIAQVVGPDNSPLPFANINIKSENFGTNADVNGNFRLISSDSLLKVEVRSVGYLPRVYTLHSNLSQNKIVLTEDENTAKEKAVVKDNGIPSNRSLRRAIFLKDSSRLNVEPVDGWDNYNTYIANSLDIPNDILKNERHGEVEISFKVNPNGAVTNIKIYQSGCGVDCAELARRLIEQGPQWVVKKGKKPTARVKVQL